MQLLHICETDSMISFFYCVNLTLILIAHSAIAVRLDEIQLLGTHNSYHIAPGSELDEVRRYAAAWHAKRLFC